MSKGFKHGFIMDGFFNNYLSQINKTNSYTDHIKNNKDELIVFVGKNVDFTEYLYISYHLNKLKSGKISYVNELKTFLWETPTSILSKTFSKVAGNSTVDLKKTLDKNNRALIFLRRSNFLGLLDTDFRESPLLDIVKLQKEINKDIILLPELLIFDKKPENIQKIVKGGKSNNFLKISYQLMKDHKHAYASLLEPINLREYITSHPDKNNVDLAESLEARILFKLEREHQIITGPTIRTPNINIEQIIKTQNVQEAIKNYAKERKKSIKDAEKKAKDILKKIAADYHITMIQKFIHVLNFLFSKLYSEIDIPQQDINKLKKLLKTHTVILAPSHKSHVDYLVLSYMFYLNGLVPPHIAAGDNLTFFPMGYIFRRSGAFFLKRSFKHDVFYYTIFKQYLSKLLRDRFSIEFFIEGTRSRTGKLLPPKTGMLSMFFDSFWENINKKIAVLPVSINYEKIVEEKSYVKELSGADKEKESFATLFNNRKLLKSRFGKVYIRFSDPIKLDDYFEENNIANQKPDDDTIKYHLNKVAYQVLNNINTASIVTASSILGSVLLSQYKKQTFEFSDALGQFISLHKELSKKKAPISKTLTTPVLALEEALEFFISNKHVTLFDKEHEIYELKNTDRAHIEYYKNSIIHYFINEALLIASVNKSANKQTIKKDTKFLSLIFQDEFIFNPNEKYEINFIQTLTDMLERKILIKDGSSITINNKTTTLSSEFYLSILMPFIEAYHYCLAQVVKLEKKTNYKNFVSTLISSAREAFEDFHYKEAINKNKFENCIKMLVDLHIVKREFEGKVKYITVIKHDELLTLMHQLKEFLIFK